MLEIKQELAQQIVEAVKEICGQDINFIDTNGIIFASTQKARIGTYHEIGSYVAKTGTQISVTEDNSFFGTQPGINLPIYHNQELFAIIGIRGEPAVVCKYAQLAERITLLFLREQELSYSSRSASDKKKYILDCLIHNKIPEREYFNELLEQLKIETQTPKRLFLFHLESDRFLEGDSYLRYTLEQQLAAFGVTLYAFQYPNQYYAMIDAGKYRDALTGIRPFLLQHQGQVKLAVGKECLFYHLFESYQSAVTAYKSMEGSDTPIIVFDDITLELILSDVSKQSAAEYLEKTLSSLTDHEKQVLKAYFHSDMSIQKTCEILYMHKNTLQYQLNRIYKKCGWNPRTFRSAVLLYLAMELLERFSDKENP